MRYIIKILSGPDCNYLDTKTEIKDVLNVAEIRKYCENTYHYYTYDLHKYCEVVAIPTI